MSSTLYCFATRALLCIFFLLPSTTDIPLLSGKSKSPTEIAVSAFSRSPSGRANTFSFPSLLLTHQTSRSVPPPSPCFFALYFPLFLSFFLLTLCPPQTFLRAVYYLGFLLYPAILSRLRYPTLSQLALSLRSPTQPCQLRLATSFSACSLCTSYCLFNFLTSLTCVKRAHSQLFS